MLHSKIMGILLSLHEKATGPLQRVFEVCMEAMENVEEEIKSVAELPKIPFTDPIKRKIQAAMEPETEPETSSPIISKKRRRTKRAKKPASEAESSTSTTSSRQKRSKKATNGYMDSTSTSSSASSLPDTSNHRVKCTLCELWVEKYDIRQHTRGHQTNITTSPSVTRSFRPSRRATKNRNQMPDFVYY